jgi:tRNA threonylcarbamoyladenosine biosynthesis protein TsaB|tara:strand:- start:1074 stop:1745 length:672 start_codon:yes stop_codon:yes gene_type:complete
MILSIDTSGPLFSIAILNNKYLEIREFEANKAQSERMIIEIQALLKTLSLSFEDVKGIAFGSGPGSFSGVRVACGIAYGIAFAKEIPINGVNTLEALAAINPNKNTISCIDARMKQMYLGAFESKNSTITNKGKMGVYDPKNLPEYQLTDPIIIGSGVKIYINQLKERYGHLNPFYDEKNYALAGIIAKLSQNRFLKDFDLVNASPSYIRNKVADTIIERLER